VPRTSQERRPSLLLVRNLRYRSVAQLVGALGKTPGIASKSTGTNQQHLNIPTRPQGRGRFWEYGQPASPVMVGS